jgi:hypothetical protein
VSQASIQMDTFYAHTATSVGVPLAALLLPGACTVRLTLDDAAQGVRADKDAIALFVEAPAEMTGSGSALAGPTETKLSRKMVGAAGFEPTISCSQSTRDAKLRYAPSIEPGYRRILDVPPAETGEVTSGALSRPSGRFGAGRHRVPSARYLAALS